MRHFILEFLLPIFTALFYFFFENAVIFSIIVAVAIIAWWKYGVSARKSMEIASYVGVVVFILWFIGEKYWDDDKSSNHKQKSEFSTSDVPNSTDLNSLASGETEEKRSTNSEDNLMAQGIWYDPKTKLYWDRCNVGQTWDGVTCQGEALKLNWQDAQDYVKQFQQAKGGFTDWRVPTIEELSSIRYCSNGWAMSEGGQESILTEQGRMRVKTIPANHGGEIQVPYKCADGSDRPSINQKIFSSTKGDFYWSSSPYADYDFLAWGVGFYNGYDHDDFKNYSSYVRAVRSD